MRNRKANYVINSMWDAKPKIVSRFITIVELYRHIFQRWSIPKDFQYWTLAGSHYSGGQPIKGELGHLLECGLIQPNQYFGVDREEFIINNNQKFFPNFNWILGDFVEVMEQAVINGEFIPEIINYDGVMQPKNSVEYLKKIMELLDYNVSNRVMLVANFVLTNPYTGSTRLNCTINDPIKRLKELYYIPDHWELYPESYQYSHSRANMGVLIFIKNEHNINSIKYTSNRIIGYKEITHDRINNAI